MRWAFHAINQITMNLKLTILLSFVLLAKMQANCITNPNLSNSLDTISRKGKDIALFFAFADYQDSKLSSLKNPISDSRALAKTLQEEYGFQYEILENPTRHQVLAKIKEYSSKKFSQEDQLLISFSGHGLYDTQLEEGFLIPSDGKADDEFHDSHISLTSLNRQIDNLPCKHIFVMIDASYSGAFDANTVKYKSRSLTRTDTFPRPNELSPKERIIINSIKYTTRIYLTSGGLERVPDGGQYSPFIGGILKVLRAKNSDDLITATDLMVSLRDVRPVPQFGEFGRNEPGSNFLFVSYTNSNIVSSGGDFADLSSIKEVLRLNENGIYSNSGLFKTGDIYTMVVEVKNTSDQSIEDVEILVEYPEDVSKNSISSFQFDEILPNSNATIQFSFFISDLYQSQEVGIKLEVKNRQSQYVDFIENIEFDLIESECIIPDRKNKDKAIIFAAKNYHYYDTLNHPILEAYALADELHANYSFECEVVENPTRLEIKQKLEEYAAKFELNSFDSTGQLLIVFTGHGDFEDGTGYFLPVDAKENDLEASSIPYSIWQRKIDRINCRHILVIIDACYSGTFEDKIANKGNDEEKDYWKRPGEYCPLLSTYFKFEDLKSRFYLTSGGNEKTPDDSELAEKLLIGLRAAKNGKQYVPIGEIYERYLRYVAPLPLLGNFGKNINGSSFMFFVNQK